MTVAELGITECQRKPFPERVAPDDAAHNTYSISFTVTLPVDDPIAESEPEPKYDFEHESKPESEHHRQPGLRGAGNCNRYQQPDPRRHGKPNVNSHDKPDINDDRDDYTHR